MYLADAVIDCNKSANAHLSCLFRHGVALLPRPVCFTDVTLIFIYLFILYNTL